MLAFGSGMATVMERRPQSARAKLKRSRTPHRWKANDQIFDLAVTFAIDEEIRKAQLQSRWQLTDAVLFGRRTLAVAIEDANAYENYRPGEALAYWSRTTKLAVRAHAALHDLIKRIGPTGVPSGDILVPMERVPSSWTKSGKITVKLLPHGQPPNQEKKDLEPLLAARDACAGFASRSQQRWKGLASRRKNEGNLGKRSFVYRLAEGWIFLTGKRPGRSYISSRNPFLRFVEAAWKDAGFHTETDFSRALDATLKRLDEYWQSRQTILSLARQGPVWK
jgi:hypothetical protein